MAALSFKDQLGNEIHLPHLPQRIVSLVPSQTELLHDLELDHEVAGITKFCIHPPEWLSNKIIIGGTKNFRFDLIDRIQPDLIIGNKEENYKEGIDALRKKYAVWMSDIFTLTDALAMMNSIGEITGRSAGAKKIEGEVLSAFDLLITAPPKKVLYLIWRNPWMAVGANTFIHSMLEKIGLQNCLANKTRYPELSAEEISLLKPECILLSSEPFPFQEKHIMELQEISPFSRIILVDGEMFSWYGSRLRKAPAYFNSLDFG